MTSSPEALARSAFEAVQQRVSVRPGGNLRVFASIGACATASVSSFHPDVGPTLAEVFCGAKPIIAASSAVLLQSRGCSLDVAIGDVIADAPEVARRVTIGGCMSHEIKAFGPSGLEWMCTQPRYRMISTPTPSAYQCYSEVLAGALVAEISSAVASERHSEAIDREVLEPMGLAQGIVVDGARARALPRDSIAHDWAPTRHGWLPMLHALVPAYRQRTSTAFNGWCDPMATHEFYKQLATDSGPFVGVGNDLLTGIGARAYKGSGARFDGLLRKKAGFRLGFCVVDETDHLPTLKQRGALLAQSGLAQKVTVIEPTSAAVITVVTDATLVADVEFRSMTDCVLQILDNA